MRQGVELINITKRFGDHTAVDDISFHVPEGSFFSLLGPSGCGKSTTLRMLSGFEDPDRGDIWIGDQRVNGVPAYRRPTNMVFQRWALFPHMTVYDNVAYGPSVRRQRGAELKRQVEDALEMVGLSALGARKPKQLSGGQMQRVALARALVNKPKVLLLDEPLGALDLKLRMQMQIELKHLQESVGATFVYVTHDQGEALTMSDNIAIMNEGRIDQIGAPHEVYDEPQTRFVATFLGNANTIPVTVEDVSGRSAKVAVKGLHFPAAVGCVPEGGAGDVVLRYEAIRLGADAEAMDVKTTARVRETVFTGAAIDYLLETAEGIALTAQQPHSADQKALQRGSIVSVGWSANAARLFPAA